MDIEMIAKAIEADAGEALPELRQALKEVQDIRASRAAGRVTTPEQLLVRAARAKLGLSQAEFAARIGTPVATLRDWEQGRFPPPGAAGAGSETTRAGPGASRQRVRASVLSASCLMERIIRQLITVLTRFISSTPARIAGLDVR